MESSIMQIFFFFARGEGVLDACMDEWMDGWIDGYVSIYKLETFLMTIVESERVEEQL